MRPFSPVFRFLIPLLLTLPAGCGSKRPELVEVRGVLLLGDKALPNAVVEFVPADASQAEMKAIGTTDDQGRFSLRCVSLDCDGAVVGMNKVLVYEEAPPAAAETRERGSRGERSSVPLPVRPNRPIPPQYGNSGATPVQIEVKAGQTEYKIELPR